MLLQDYPYPHGDYLYYTKTEEGKSYKVHCRRPAAGGPEEVVLDENVEAEGLPYFEVGTVKPSPTHQKLVYTVDTKGHEDYQVLPPFICADGRGGGGVGRNQRY